MANRVRDFKIKIDGILSSSLTSAFQRMQNLFSGMARRQAEWNNANQSTAALRQQLKEMQALQKQMTQLHAAQQKVRDLRGERQYSRNVQQQLRSEYSGAEYRLQELKMKLGVNDPTHQLTRRQKDQMREVYNEYKEVAKQMREIQKEMNQESTKESRITSQLNGQRNAVHQLRSALREAGVDLQNFANAESQLADRITQATNNLNQQTQRQTRLNQANARMEQASFSMNNAYSSFQGATDIATTIFNPISNAVQVSQDFEQASSRVQAIMSAGKSERVDMSRIEAMAEQLGATTSFKASEAMDAAYYAAIAGWKEDQIIAAMPNVLNLAQAGGVDIARAMDVITDEMTAFGLDTTNGEVIKNYVDQFAYTMSNSNTDLEQLHEALKYAAPALKMRGASVTESMTQLAMMANSGIKGSMAGTASRKFALYTMNLDTVDQVEKNAMAKFALQDEGVDINSSDFKKRQAEAREAMSGIFSEEQMKSFQDAEHGYSNFLKAMGEATKGKSGEEIAAMIQPLTGLTAFSGIAPVIEAAANGQLETFLQGIESQENTAENIAKVMMDNAAGSKKIYESAVEAFQKKVGDSFLPMQRQFYETMGSMFGNMAQWAGENQTLITTLGTIAGSLAGIVVAGAGVNLAFSAINYAGAGIGLLSTKISMLPQAFSAASAALRGGFLAIAGLSAPVLVGLGAIAAAAYLIYSNWESIGPALSNTFIYIKTELQSAMNLIGPAIDNMSLAFSNLAGNLSSLDFSAITNALQEVALLMAGFVAGLAVALTSIITIIVQIGSSIIEGFGVAFDAVRMMIHGDFEGAWLMAKENICAIVSSLADHIMGTLGRAASAISGIISNIGSAISSIGQIEVSGGGLSQMNVAHNAIGGIYPRGAFLTTFAEDSAEAAIPLDGSSRAISLWQQAGEILGVYNQESNSNILSSSKNSSMLDLISNIGSNSISDLVSSVRSNPISDLISNIGSSSISDLVSSVRSNPISDLISNIGSSSISDLVSSVRANPVADLISNISSSSISKLSSSLGSESTLNIISHQRENSISNIFDSVRSRTASIFSSMVDQLGLNQTTEGSIRSIVNELPTFSESTSEISSPSFSVSFTINGNADRAVLEEAARDMQMSFEEQYRRFMHERSRVSYV